MALSVAVPERMRGLQGWRRGLIAATLGAVTALAQPPVSQPIVLFLAFPLLFWLLEGTRSPWEGFWLGWFAGAGHFAIALFWIVDPFLVDAQATGWMAPFALAGMSGGLAFFWALPFFLARARWPAGLRRALALAALWTLADVLRSHVLGGFPWGLVGYAWVETPVMQVDALGGPHLLGLLTLVAALLPAVAGARGLVLTGLLVAAGWSYGSWRLAQPVPVRPEPVRVRLVQPDARQEDKWRPGMEQVFFDRHLTLTAASNDDGTRPDITIWSETAVPFLLGRDDALVAASAQAAAPGRLILGIRRLEEDAAGDERWFNSLAVLDGNGEAAAVYDKYRLVPFGEYIPLAGFVASLGLSGLDTMTLMGFTPGTGPHVLSAPGVPPFLPLICYEAVFPHGLDVPGERPDWLVQVTNDAWFGTASGPFQHLAQARARAIEQGLPLARAANTGISAMIDPYGRVMRSLALGETGSIDTILPGRLSPTPYSYLRNSLALIASVLLIALTFIDIKGSNFLKRR